MAKEKIDIMLEKIELLEKGQQSLEKGQQRNYDLIQKQGVMLEQVASDVKAVAEGHAVIRSEMRRGFSDVKEQIKLVDDKVTFVADKVIGIEKEMKEHIRQPAHAV
ncbi:hypothetical protein HZC34_00920 [Candidatus Saganbacteria bacterium]|nr:hypothetical protein [Candidatus Saganbacteria bacterium]